jgi:hypothetical protein
MEIFIVLVLLSVGNDAEKVFWDVDGTEWKTVKARAHFRNPNLKVGAS